MKNEEKFIALLKENQELMQILDSVAQLQLKNWYLAAGCIFQTVWNIMDEKPAMTGVHDIDLIYFDAEMSLEAAKNKDKLLEKNLSEKFPYLFDVHNEAFMHLWHGGSKVPYQDSENAIERWIATVHAVGITGNSKEIKLFAPYGLEDIFTKTIRPILQMDNHQALYEAKVAKWQARFNDLRVLDWQYCLKMQENQCERSSH